MGRFPGGCPGLCIRRIVWQLVKEGYAARPGCVAYVEYGPARSVCLGHRDRDLFVRRVDNHLHAAPR